MRLFWSLVFGLFSLCANGQFRASVECSNFNLVSDSTYSGTLKNWIDQSDEGYLPSGVVVDSMYLVDAVYRVYQIKLASGATFSKVDVEVQGLKNYGVRPTGRGQIHRGLPENLKPVTPDNNKGISPILRSKIETDNYKRIADSLRLLLNNSIDSIKLENDSISVYYHRKGLQRIASGSGVNIQSETGTVTGSFFVTNVIIPANPAKSLEIVRDGFSMQYLRDYTINIDTIKPFIPFENEFITIKAIE